MSPFKVSLQNWNEKLLIPNWKMVQVSELQTHPNLHSPVWVGEMTQIKHTQVCSLVPG